MRRYVIGLVFTAVLVGSLFRAADETGVRLMRMFGTLGVLVLGVIGTMALTRIQSRQGLKEIEGALKSLEPDAVITDWVYQGRGRPDFLVVGPGGITAICLEEMPQSTWTRVAASKVARGRERSMAAAAWVRERLAEQAVPVHPLLVLTRRRALPEYTTAEVPVLNADGVAEQIHSTWQLALLDPGERFRLTRSLRSA